MKKELRLLEKIVKICHNRGFDKFSETIIEMAKEELNLSKDDILSIKRILRAQSKTTNKATFIEKSLYNNICDICEKSITIGDPIYLSGKIAIHKECMEKNRKNENFTTLN